MRQQPASKRKIKAHARQPQEFVKLISKSGYEQRWQLGISELDRVLGGGVVPGSLILLTGEPGIGKSTLTLQIAEKISSLGKKVLYISGEESEEQISSRGSRLGLGLKNLQLLSESNLETILSTAEEQQPEFLIVDSIQVISSQNIPGSSGSVSQVRLCAEAILEFAKPKRLPVLLTGHVTKDGTLAGPRVLEHLVDTVLYLEGNRMYDVRLLRGVKNRFGAVSEVGIFEMAQNGLCEVKNPSEKFLSQRQAATPGVALASTMEGTRPLIVEVQALTAETRFGYPRRTASGFDVNRLQLLIAVIERHLNIHLGAHDVYVNVVGGLKLQDPACDLGICLAIVSSLKKKNIPQNTVLLGEVGLTGEIRLPSKIEIRKREAEKLGLKIFPTTNRNHLAGAVKELLSL